MATTIRPAADASQKFVPREHGATAMLLIPFFAAAILLRQFYWTEIVALAAVVCAFAIKDPLVVLARQRFVWKQEHAETKPALRSAVLEFVLLAACGGAPADARLASLRFTLLGRRCVYGIGRCRERSKPPALRVVSGRQCCSVELNVCRGISIRSRPDRILGLATVAADGASSRRRDFRGSCPLGCAHCRPQRQGSRHRVTPRRVLEPSRPTPRRGRVHLLRSLLDRRRAARRRRWISAGTSQTEKSCLVANVSQARRTRGPDALHRLLADGHCRPVAVREILSCVYNTGSGVSCLNPTLLSATAHSLQSVLYSFSFLSVLCSDKITNGFVPMRLYRRSALSRPVRKGKAGTSVRSGIFSQITHWDCSFHTTIASPPIKLLRLTTATRRSINNTD